MTSSRLFLLQDDADPAAMLERVFQTAEQAPLAPFTPYFSHWGANHDERRRANAPSVTRRQLDALLGLGRNRAKDLFPLG